MPKALVPIHGEPFLGYLLNHYKEHDIVLSIGYRAKDIKSFCKDNNYFVEFVEENKPLGTCGAIKYSTPFMKDNEEFCVMNGDTYIEIDLDKILSFHKMENSLLTNVTAVNMLGGMRQNSGIYIINTNLLKDFNYGDTIENYMAKSTVSNEYRSNNGFCDIGSFKGLRYCKEHMFGGKYVFV